jgi:hypothetical protein
MAFLGETVVHLRKVRLGETRLVMPVGVALREREPLSLDRVAHDCSRAIGIEGKTAEYFFE